MPKFRTVDVARRAGYSVQQIRNLERAGVLPPATRTATGFRVYTEVQLQSALAYRELAVAVGPVEAKRIVRSVHTCPAAATVALLDAAHARLHTERAELALAKDAAAVISAEQIEDVRASDWMSVAELAAALGVRTSTLRHWDTEELVIPDRKAPTRERRYSPSQVRDARIVHQLRKAGYRIAPLRAVMAQLRRPAGSGDIGVALAVRDETLTGRSRALVDATAALAGLLPPSGVSPRATAPQPENRSRR
ncbi:MerR family transcriptional regulator [Rhodococcus opacus]|uniref:Putative MerR family transcriptional regulator n=1 Tax=Rhodococcus opacus (strain B4) TaxID=632772 RepID=C1ARB9_RHOOB|nr:MerR family transcriptional regulator [Rhodococcus opacus]BAH48596.1 putative MerR family transcriptional regulator [Rhodococcus opacus B4]